MALREKQVQQNYRPVIAVHKWFARRPGTLFRSLLLSEFGKSPLRELYFKANDLSGLRVADPFMGGGTPLLEANRVGCDIIGFDNNPMAYWIVRQEVEHVDLADYIKAANKLTGWLERQIGHLYRTDCLVCGCSDARVKYFLWVKLLNCGGCGKSLDLFSRYLLSEDRRHPRNVFVCPACGELNESKSRTDPGSCRSCRAQLSEAGVAKQSRRRCGDCGTTNTYPQPKAGPPRHRMFAIEYHCSKCRQNHQGRFFKKPDRNDLEKYTEAGRLWGEMKIEFVPNDPIPKGDETDRLHRWGYNNYSEMFNSRQLLGLELSCRAIATVGDQRVKGAMATNLSDLLRYQNMLCRYDTMALKSLDIFSVHGFPVGLIQCESNLLGIASRGAGVNVGSGGWSNIVEKYRKAKIFCDRPFEIQHRSGKKIVIPILDEWIGDGRRSPESAALRSVSLHCQTATLADIPPSSLDAVFTDPPYFGNVQYAELMDFCYVWLRRLLSPEVKEFLAPSTRSANELTGNTTMSRGPEHFTAGISEVFSRMAKALKPGAPLAFTYHHNRLESYLPIAVSILDSGLTCTATIPCPAEMGASIHINGTGSSIVDTIFVCRSTGTTKRRWLAETPEEIAGLVREDIARLQAGKVTPSTGDIRCVLFGHLTRLAVWALKPIWDPASPVEKKLTIVASHLDRMGWPQKVEQALAGPTPPLESLSRATISQ